MSALGQPGKTKPPSARAALPDIQHSLFLPLATLVDTVLGAALAIWTG